MDYGYRAKWMPPPRRMDIYRRTWAERAIDHAMEAVERAGAHPALSDSLWHLIEAQRILADWVDGAPFDTDG